LSVLQIGRDLYSGEELPIDQLPSIRRMTRDIPLVISVSEHEFMEGIQKQSLPGGVEYVCRVKDIDTANRLAVIAREYRAPEFA